MRKDNYVFPAILDFADDGISVEFPDLPGCLPCAMTQEEALKNAREAMGLHLWSMEDDGEQIPEPTMLTELKLATNQSAVLVDVWMPAVRDRLNNNTVNKNVTIPAWLDRLAKASGINYSAILQEALRLKLSV